jgi:hypothetical protein
VLGWTDPVLDFLPELASAEKVVLMLYAAATNHEGHAWPSVATLARRSGYSERAIKATRRTLVERGLLVRDGDAIGSRGQPTPRFRVKGGEPGFTPFRRRRH